MLIKTILNHVYRHKGFVYKEVLLEKTPTERIIVEVEAKQGSRALCSHCEVSCPGYDKLPERQFAFVPLWNIPVWFRYRPRRVECKTHGVVVEKIPWGDGKRHLTVAHALFLADWAKRLSILEVARRFRASWEQVRAAIGMVVEYGLKHRNLDGIESIGVDEMAIGEGQDYMTAVYQLDEGHRRLLWVGKDRKAKTLLRFFVFIGKQRYDKIRFACTDMWKPYLKVIAKKIPQALNILDRFHIMKKFNEAIDDVRRQETFKLKQQKREPVLTKARWLLLKHPRNLTEKQKPRLKELLLINLKSVRAYLLREEFQHFWTYTSATWASKFLSSWIRMTMRSKIKPMKKVAKMLRKHQPLILNWFEAKGAVSSGMVEALNNTAQLAIRQSYGFRKFRTMELMLYHKLGNLPPPPLTHKFC
jgi:transposase